jgi:hypothetical protein
MSGKFTIWIWPIRIGSVASALKPPQLRISLLLVDDEVHAEPERHAHDADDVLDHLVGGIQIERVLARRERAEVGRADEAALVNCADAFFHAQLVELGNTPSVPAHRCHPAPRCVT